MGFMTTSRIVARLLPQSQADDALFLRERPELVVLPPDPSLPVSSKPPVRIFLGTEPGQYRAERVFIWSVEQTRDRSRRYEIHLMKDLAGFDRRLWLTGFTNYRLAIPHLAGGYGRAIYNDVDQVYLADPAELFDADMHGRGFLALSSRDTAVMLIDCERMKSVWTLEAAQHGRRKSIEESARDLWGKLEPAWHCRDWEWVPGKSKCVHFTTIHTQPWHPMPSVFVYQHNPIDHVFYDLERRADAACFHAFSLEHPSLGWSKVVADLAVTSPRVASARTSTGRAESKTVREWVTKVGAHSVLEFGMGVGIGVAGEATDEIARKREGTSLVRFDPTAEGARLPAGRFDAIICTHALEHLLDDDVVWVLAELFGRANKLVHVTVHQAPTTGVLGKLGRKRRAAREPAWWFDRIREAAVLYPHVAWNLELTIRDRAGNQRHWRREGGLRHDRPVRAWVIADDDPDHTEQSTALARGLGWPFEVKPLRDATPCDAWPDVVLSTGASGAAIARELAARSDGDTRAVLLGRRGANVVRGLDAAVTCSHWRLPPSMHRVETLAPLTTVTPDLLASSLERWPARSRSSGRRRVALLLPGGAEAAPMDAPAAGLLAGQLRRWADSQGAEVVVLASHPVGRHVRAAIEGGLGPVECLPWSPHEESPYLARLAAADLVVVTDRDESVVARAVASGKPVTIYFVAPARATLGERLAELVTRVAYSRPRKKKGTVRPQQGREYLCSRLIERGLVRPPRRPNVMCERLVRDGYARRFADPASWTACKRLDQSATVAAEVTRLIGWTAPAERADTPDLQVRPARHRANA